MYCQRSRDGIWKIYENVKVLCSQKPVGRVLLAEKKEAYADYHKVWDEIKELLTVKANVDRFLGQDGQKQEKEDTRRED